MQRIRLPIELNEDDFDPTEDGDDFVLSHFGDNIWRPWVDVDVGSIRRELRVEADDDAVRGEMKVIEDDSKMRSG
jgi:hypothetical protein